MQEALKNPHYKKIWEKVNWKVRHPEAKNLEEALVWESNTNEALVATGCGTIYRCEDVEFCEENPYSVGINPKNNIKIKNEYNREGGYQCIILGRPIKLDDILILGKKYCDGILSLVVNDDGYATILNSEKNLYIRVQLTKPLHEQTPEAWEKIAEII